MFWRLDGRGPTVWIFEVSLHKRLLFIVGLVAALPAVALAQTAGTQGSLSVPAGETKPGEVMPATQQIPVVPPVNAPGMAPIPPAIAPPVPESIDQIQTLPAYGRQQTQPAVKPIPQPVGPPVALPAQPSDANPVAALPPYRPYGPLDEDRKADHAGSTYIPLDSWMYPGDDPALLTGLRGYDVPRHAAVDAEKRTAHAR